MKFRQKARSRFVAALVLVILTIPLWTWVVLGIRSGVTDWLFPVMLAGMTLTAIAWSFFWAGVELRRQAEDWEAWPAPFKEPDKNEHRRLWMEGGKDE